jgi:hypothetical protein
VVAVAVIEEGDGDDALVLQYIHLRVEDGVVSKSESTDHLL